MVGALMLAVVGEGCELCSRNDMSTFNHVVEIVRKCSLENISWGRYAKEAKLYLHDDSS